TGKMGAAIALRFAETGHDLTLWNRTPSRAEVLGVGRLATSPADAVGGAGLVVSCLTGPEALRTTFGGPSGALAAARGQLFVEMSTAGPDVVAELAPQVAASGSTLVDIPIIATPPVVQRGAALLVAGGADDDVARATSLLEPLGEVRHVGPLGSGARLKLVANSMVGVVSMAGAELQVAGEAAGLDPEVVFSILVRLAPSLEARREGFLRGSHEPALFAVGDLRKDLDLGLGMFHDAGRPVPVTGLVRELVAGEVAEDAGRDVSAVIRRYRQPPDGG
ncbi:MAG TPA: NAD(P)-dependent oxidoreductase, partial [Acidimicrobiales bacterium]|nr:NAD(P)-dependent oxidoreductase [Acidimicrobiales bacterium]